MKLITVAATLEYVIVVPNNSTQQEQEAIASDYVRDAFRDVSVSDLPIEVSPYAPGDASGWDGDCIPYAGDGNTPTKWYLANPG